MMSLLDWIGISSVQAADMTTAQHPGSAGLFSPMIIMLLFIAVFYFLLIRPQNRKRKEHAQLIKNVSVGDDVMTIGGILGRVSALKDDFIQVLIAKDTVVMLQKSAIANILPKGTFEV